MRPRIVDALQGRAAWPSTRPISLPSAPCRQGLWRVGRCQGVEQPLLKRVAATNARPMDRGSHGTALPTAAALVRALPCRPASCGAMFAAVFLIFCTKIALRYCRARRGGLGRRGLRSSSSSGSSSWPTPSSSPTAADHVSTWSPHMSRRAGSAGWRSVALDPLSAASSSPRCPATLDYILFLWRERTPVLQLRLDIVYACFGIFVVAVPHPARLGALARLPGTELATRALTQRKQPARGYEVLCRWSVFAVAPCSARRSGWPCSPPASPISWSATRTSAWSSTRP